MVGTVAAGVGLGVVLQTAALALADHPRTAATPLVGLAGKRAVPPMALAIAALSAAAKG